MERLHTKNDKKKDQDLLRTHVRCVNAVLGRNLLWGCILTPNTAVKFRKKTGFLTIKARYKNADAV